jgi:BirA family transcriptional regulator, biotin operon repressor / biotin---[acetyl-CoA-carboxylase] ligase
MSVAERSRPDAEHDAEQRARPGTVGAALHDTVTDVTVTDVTADRYDGVDADGLRELLGVPAVHLYARAGSTLDIAHDLAARGAPHGSLVIAESQTRGRGRAGKRWTSPPGTGLWLTIIARPATADSVRVLTVRLGLAAARALDAFAAHPVQLKWPNDLYVGAGKLAGVLVEARWRGAAPEWLAVGIGINVIVPDDTSGAAGLRTGTARLSVLMTVVPALMMALAHPDDLLDDAELRDFARRDRAAGRRADAPARGTVIGINHAAELLITTSTGEVAVSSGSLVLSEDT